MILEVSSRSGNSHAALSLGILTVCFLICTTLGDAQETPSHGEAYLRGRSSVRGKSGARQLDSARRQHLEMLSQPRNSNLTTSWTAVGPAQVVTAEFGEVTGRVTSIVLDPADSSGNTVYLGTTGGGVWKSTNAAGPSSAVTFSPLTDNITSFAATSQTIPSLSVGSLALANGVLLAGTGDPNDATDSYYGVGILRSADGGITWTIAQQSTDGVAQGHSFFGLSVAGLAFSTLNPSLVIAAFSQAGEGVIANVPDSEMGLYYSTDTGLTWHMATLQDGSQTVQSAQTSNATTPGNAATSVVWNPLRQTFIAAVRYHGFYSSSDGITWTRLVRQPGTGLTPTACPPQFGTSGSPACPMFRGALTVQVVSGDTFALTTDSNNQAQGLFQDSCVPTGASCNNPALSFGTQLNSAPLLQGTIIPQADYNLTIAATPSGADTILYVGTTDIYRCTLASGCTFRNTTNADNGCTNPAMVSPAQHAIAIEPTANGPLLYIGNDGGLWRSLDGINQTAAPCSLDDATHFQNLNAGLGSLAEVVNFAQSPTTPSTLLAGLGALGTAGTFNPSHPWTQLSAGEGSTVAIDPSNPLAWFLSTGGGVHIATCSMGPACGPSNFISTIGSAQVSNEVSAVHAPWLLDPGNTSGLIVGTCRVWRGPANGAGLWSPANAIGSPFGSSAATACGSTSPVVRSLATGGPVVTSALAQNTGSQVLYAGIAGSLDGGQGIAGHVFVTRAADFATSSTRWTDAATSPVVNDTSNAGVFNPGGFDVSSLVADSHDATGATVYATIMGFDANGISAPHIYRSTDTGAHWSNVTANLPDAPANSLAVDPNDANTIYVALDTGVYVTTAISSCASANCWSVYGISLPNSPVIQLEAAAGMSTGDGRTGELRAATYGRGIWQIPLLTASAPATPILAINPSTLNYPAQQVGTISQSLSMTITNTGTAALNVSSILVSGDFAETDSCVGTPVAQNATCQIQTTFLPTSAGSRTGMLTVYANIAGGQATATLSGIGTPAAAIVLTPTALVYPATNVGATSIPQTITVSNTGGSPAALQSPIVSGDYALSGTSCSSTLAASTGCTLSITFVPSAPGVRSGTLTISDSAGTQVATLSGTATNPATDTLAPLNLSFATQQLGTVSAPQQVSLTNAGDVALTLISPQVTSGDFILASGCGNSLAARSTCAITVTFSPSSIGPQVGSLSISDQFRTQTVSLSGSGLAGPGVSLSPTSGVAFGATGVGESAPSQILTLSNNGGVPLAIASIAVNGDYSLLTGSNTCGATLAPNAACSLQVVFLPTVAGLRTGSVTFTDNAGSSPQTLALSGTGIDFSLTPNGPSSITLSSGGVATYALLLTSIAGLPGSAAFTCAGFPAHSTCTVNPATTTLGGSTNISVTVATGLSSAELRPQPMPWHRQLLWLALLVPLSIASRRFIPRWSALALILLAAFTGCSAGRTIPATSTPVSTVYVTPSGTNTLVVAASSAGVVHALNLTLVIQ